MMVIVIKNKDSFFFSNKMMLFKNFLFVFSRRMQQKEGFKKRAL
jgi:hypothetical protein